MVNAVQVQITVYYPTKIKLNNIIQIKCGNNHTILKQKKENKTKYYSFGYNEYNQCLLNNDHEYYVYQPKLIDLEHIKNKIGLNNIILNLLPGFNETFIISTNKRINIY